ncbi:MAG: DciA family protein [Pseudomonadota bacterium]
MSATSQLARSINARRVRAKAVGAFVPKLTEKAFAKFGFSAVAMISDWSRIAGPTLAAHTAPERLKWPRPVQKFGDVEDGCEGRPGATLLLRVDPARALEVEYGAAQLIERINGYFGYRAVAKIKLIQAPLISHRSITKPVETDRRRQPNRVNTQSQRPKTPSPSEIKPIKNAELKAALERLKTSIKTDVAA